MHVSSSELISWPQTYSHLNEKVEENWTDLADLSLQEPAAHASSIFLSFVMVQESFREPSPEITKRIYPVDPTPAPSRLNPFSTLYNIYHTATTWISQKKNVSYEAISFPQAWQMFNSAIVHHYINHLKEEKVNFKFVRNFLIIKPEINLCSLKDIFLTLESEIAEAKSSTNESICIPLVLAGKQNLSSNHIVALLIKDGMIEYFDSLGIPSDQILLGNSSESIRNVLEHLQAKWGFQIIEHRDKLQSDVHNCGVFVCEFYRQRLINETKMGSMLEALSDNELLLARDTIFSAIFPTMKTETEINLKRDAEPSLYNEFDAIFDDLLKADS